MKSSVAVALVSVAVVALTGCSSGGADRSESSDVVSPAGSDSVVATAPTLPAAAAPRTTSVTATPDATQPNPCAHNAGRLVRVRIRVQHLWMCQGQRVVRSTAITSGIPGVDTHTPKGTYRVQALTRDTTLTLITGQTYPVKYWIPFDGPLFGFHDSSWQDFPYGSARYRTEGSHGCVHMPLKSIRFLYGWAGVGTTVRITA